MKSIQGNQIRSIGGTDIVLIILLRQRHAEGQLTGRLG